MPRFRPFPPPRVPIEIPWHPGASELSSHRKMLALSGANLAFTLHNARVNARFTLETYPAHAHRSSRADMLGGFFGKDDPKAKKKGNVDNGLLPFDFPELPEVPELPSPKWLVTSWWTSTFAPAVDAIPFYVRGEGLALGPLGKVPLWFIFGYLGPCADPSADPPVAA